MKIQIVGTRGIPAEHGGFETFTEHFAVYLQKKGWQVTVYCQEEGSGEIFEDEWCGIYRVHIPVPLRGAKGTIVFDWKSTCYAINKKNPVLILGYNTALFSIYYRLKGIKNIINMDGVEWRRAKWSFWQRTWLYMNEKLGAWLGNQLIADHPSIKVRLSRFTSSAKITMIPYGTDIVQTASKEPLDLFGLQENSYALVIARPEQENSILEIVKAYSSVKRGCPLVILGKYTPDSNRYHQAVLEAAGEEVRFVGAIYDKATVQSLRFFARFYIHGHTVGGTNPSLVESLGTGTPIIAHNNKYNRWVAGSNALYFSTIEDCAKHIEMLLQDDGCVIEMKKHSLQRAEETFRLEAVHHAYEQLLLQVTEGKEKGRK
ncbi:MAG: DUF1972 domain-containing protein [Candidatus Electrothrix sp. AUS1_2]|nr:DUF1972 domain-containing protein [Candidatus Electrothrix sp. AUS1_2]